MKTRRGDYPPRNNKRIKLDASTSSSTEDTIGVDDTHRFCRNIDLTNKGENYGWVVLKDEKMPYIIRANEKFCSVKMIEERILKRHYSKMHPGVYCCTKILRYKLTQLESDLLAKINDENPDGKLVEAYNSKTDMMIKFDDAEHLIKFYNFCYTKLQNHGRIIPNSPCGFIQIDCLGAVPFTIANGKHYCPVYYFPALLNRVNTISLSPEDWALAYLKFCSRMIGYKRDFIDSYTQSLVNLDDLKRNLPANTTYQEWWP